MTKLFFDTLRHGKELFAILQKHRSPAADYAKNVRAHVLTDDFGGGADAAAKRLSTILKQKKILLANATCNNIRAVVDDIKSRGFLHILILQNENPNRRPLDDLVFVCSDRAATAQAQIARLSGAAITEPQPFNPAAMRNFFNLNMLCFNAFASGNTLDSVAKYAAFKETCRIFAAEGDTRTAASYQAAFELEQLKAGNLDARIYPPALLNLLVDSVDDIRIRFLMPGAAKNEELYSNARLLSLYNGASDASLEKAASRFKEMGYKEAADTLLDHRNGRTTAGLMKMVEDIRAFRTQPFRARQPELTDPSRLAAGLNGLARNHPANLYSSGAVYKTLSGMMEKPEFFSPNASTAFDPRAVLVYYNAGMLLVIDRLAAALQKLAPAACAKAGLDIATIRKIRNAADVAPPSRPQTTRAEAGAPATRAHLN